VIPTGDTPLSTYLALLAIGLPLVVGYLWLIP
jgi:hypothetical protein